MKILPFLFVVGLLWLMSACDKSDTRLHHLYLVTSTDMITPGDTLHFLVKAYPPNADAGFPSESPRWSCSDTTVATITDAGIMYAHKYGPCTIRVDMGGFWAEKQIMVSAVADIPDSLMREFLLSQFDIDGDGQLAGYETYNFNSIDLSPLSKAGEKGVSLKGLEHFVNLQILRMEHVHARDLNLAALPSLQSLDFEDCYLDTIDLRANKDIVYVRCLNCPTLKYILFGSYDEYGVNQLSTLQCDRCDIRELDLSRCGRTLGDIECRQNPNLSVLNLSADTMLHTVKYSPDYTQVVWPPVDIDIIIRETD